MQEMELESCQQNNTKQLHKFKTSETDVMMRDTNMGTESWTQKMKEELGSIDLEYISQVQQECNTNRLSFINSLYQNLKYMWIKAG